jgi:site-specific recombinase XerC
MVNKQNWHVMNKYLEYRSSVDQISKGSLGKEVTHMRYLLEWAQEISFKQAATIRPTFPEYLLSNRISDKEGQLSAVYIKKMLATARLFFTWLSDNEAGYKHIKQAWIKTIKVKRLSNAPRTSEYATIEEMLVIAARPAQAAQARRARAGLVFLFLSGMRIGAFVSLPLQAVDIPNRTVYQYPSLGVRTKNNKHAKTSLLDIPELIKVVQDWDDEVRAILPPNGLWFAPFSPQTGLIDPAAPQAGEHRINLARRNFKSWMEQEELPYHSPHKFRHGHIHYGLSHAKDVADFKAVSMNAMHANMEITDQFYSVLRDDEVKNRIGALNKSATPSDKNDLVKLLESMIANIKDN